MDKQTDFYSDEQALVNALNIGQDWAYRVLMQDYIRVVSRYLSTMKNDQVMVEEAIAETLVVISKKAGAGQLVLNEGVRFLTLLIGIARRQMLKQMGKTNYFGFAGADLTEEQLAEWADDDFTEDEEVCSARRTAFLKAFAGLNQTYQYVLEAYYFFGMSMQEIAVELYGDAGREATVRKKKYKAMQQLRTKVFACMAD